MNLTKENYQKELFPFFDRLDRAKRKRDQDTHSLNEMVAYHERQAKSEALRRFPEFKSVYKESLAQDDPSTFCMTGYSLDKIERYGKKNFYVVKKHQRKYVPSYNPESFDAGLEQIMVFKWRNPFDYAVVELDDGLLRALFDDVIYIDDIIYHDIIKDRNG